MKQFMDENFLLNNDTAKVLFFDAAKDMPIFDFHNHLDAQEIYEDKKFKSQKHLKKNCTLAPLKCEERWPSGRRRTPGERVSAKSASWVRIPVSPPYIKKLNYNTIENIKSIY